MENFKVKLPVLVYGKLKPEDFKVKICDVSHDGRHFRIMVEGSVNQGDVFFQCFHAECNEKGNLDINPYRNPVMDQSPEYQDRRVEYVVFAYRIVFFRICDIVKAVDSYVREYQSFISMAFNQVSCRFSIDRSVFEEMVKVYLYSDHVPVNAVESYAKTFNLPDDAVDLTLQIISSMFFFTKRFTANTVWMEI